MGKLVKCFKCGYKWFYKGERMYSNCPSCFKLVKIYKNKKWVYGDE